MKAAMMFALAAALNPAWGQQVQPTITIRGTVLADGSRHPELIADATANKAFFMSVSEPTNAKPAESDRMRAKISPLGLTTRDEAILVAGLTTFHDAWQPLRQRTSLVAAGISSKADTVGIGNYHATQGQIDDLCSNTFLRLKSQLSRDGVAKLDAHLARIKTRVKIVPKPRM
jgi:hypothetical protein